MTDPTDLDRAVAAFVTATAEQREAAVALDRYRIGAWLRSRSGGWAVVASAIENGDHIDDDQPPIPSLRLVMAARDEFMRRTEAAEAESKRLRDLVKSAYLDGWDTGQCRAGYGNPLRDWSNSSACAEVSRG